MTSYRSERAFGTAEISSFLAAVDRHLARPIKLVIIGGGAAALAYGVMSTTTDIDVLTSGPIDVEQMIDDMQIRTSDLDTLPASSDELRDAIGLAIAETGLAIEVSSAGIAQLPANAEDRLQRKLPELGKLHVWVPEKHDLVLSKALRCYEHDLQQIRQMRDAVGLSFEILVERFMDEMTSVVGDPKRIRADFLVMIDDVFGELKRVDAEKRLGVG